MASVDLDSILDRNFEGIWIPRVIWTDGNLTAIEKVILAEIGSLSSEKRGCFASNKYLADFCGCSERKISEAISKLTSYGLVYVQSFNGRQRELRSRVADSAMQSSRKCYAESQNPQAINNTNKKRYKENIEENIYESKKRFEPPTVEEVRAYCKERGNNVDAERFVAFYESKGWMVGKNRMKNWKASVITWERKDDGKQKPKNKFHNFDERQDENYDELFRAISG